MRSAGSRAKRLDTEEGGKSRAGGRRGDPGVWVWNWLCCDCLQDNTVKPTKLVKAWIQQAENERTECPWRWEDDCLGN